MLAMMPIIRMSRKRLTKKLLHFLNVYMGTIKSFPLIVAIRLAVNVFLIYMGDSNLFVHSVSKNDILQGDR